MLNEVLNLVFVLQPIYSFLATVYFPRNCEELISGQDTVKCLSWNKWGACSYNEREIRVIPIERTNNTEEEGWLRYTTTTL